jgi:hypothetical protein
MIQTSSNPAETSRDEHPGGPMSTDKDKAAIERDVTYLRGLSSDRFEETIIKWLLGQNQRRRAIAEQLLVRLGTAGSRLLIYKAAGHRAGNSRRTLLLSAVARLGLPLTQVQWFDMMSLSRQSGPEVRSQMIQHLIRTGDLVSGSTAADVRENPAHQCEADGSKHTAAVLAGTR